MSRACHDIPTFIVFGPLAPPVPCCADICNGLWVSCMSSNIGRRSVEEGTGICVAGALHAFMDIYE